MDSVKSGVVDELLKPIRKNFVRRPYAVRGIGEFYQADLVDMQPLSKFNDGYKYLLTIIDVFSKKGFAVPVRNKTGVEVTAAMAKVLESAQVPKLLQTDDGKEFFNKSFAALMNKYNIRHYSTYSGIKASVVERWNQTLRHEMWRKFHYNGSYRYVDFLPQLLLDYNNRIHRKIKMAPNQVSSSNQQHLLDTVYSERGGGNFTPKFKVNDPVRVSKVKGTFAKSYTGNWSPEIFHIDTIHSSVPVTYTIRDKQGELIRGRFYAEELQKTSFDNVYLIDKVLKKTPKKLYVSWLGFKEKGWINRKDIV